MREPNHQGEYQIMGRRGLRKSVAIEKPIALNASLLIQCHREERRESILAAERNRNSLNLPSRAPNEADFFFFFFFQHQPLPKKKFFVNFSGHRFCRFHLSIENPLMRPEFSNSP